MKKSIAILMLLILGLCISTIAEQTDNHVDPDKWPSVAALGLSNDVMMSIYNDYETAWETYPETIDEATKYEEKVSQEIAEKYGLTTEQADMVYYYVVANYEKVARGGIEYYSYSLQYGDLLSVNNSGSTVVIKAKIKPSLTNKMTIDQNYYNVCDLIQNQGLDVYEKIEYWAVADLTSGKEGKVISFTLPKALIDRIAQGEFPENKLGDHAEDLWVLPSLLE